MEVVAAAVPEVPPEVAAAVPEVVPEAAQASPPPETQPPAQALPFVDL